MGAVKESGMDELINFGMEIIRGAGDEAMSFYGKGSSDVKFDDGVVTEAELRLMEFFQKQLKKKFPKHLAFENRKGKMEYSEGEKKYLWIFNALDGVANFQAGFPIWGISLSLLENFWPMFGLFHMPATGDIFRAQAGKRAFWGDKEISVSEQQDINDESLFLTYSRFHNDYTSTFPGKIRDFGCTIAHLCYVATGRAEGAIVANESYQNMAAASVIVEAAGGKIYKMDGKELILNEYLDEERVNEDLLITSPHMYSQIRGYLEANS